MTEEIDTKLPTNEGGFTATAGSLLYPAGAVLYAAMMEGWPVPPSFDTLSLYDQVRLNRVAFTVINWHGSLNDKSERTAE